MIGQLILPVRTPTDDAELIASLRDDFTWQCEDPEWATMLNARFPGPADAHANISAGRFLLYRAAERLSARVVLGESERPVEFA